jgi:RNA methyltransferase, TrmH family
VNSTGKHQDYSRKKGEVFIYFRFQVLMLSNSSSKFIKSLQLKKYRREHSSFFVEGRINVLEVLESNFEVISVLVTSEYVSEVKDYLKVGIELIEVKEADLAKIGTYQSNNFGLAVVRMPDENISNFNNQEWSLAFDDINDPGNLGTIVRTADWFGIKNIYCSMESVDFYNPKVINSTKGSFSRVNVHYVDLEEFLKDKEVVSAEMNGTNLHQYIWATGGVILMGNESHGVKNSLSKLCKQKITIPRVGGAESLNVAVATSIIIADLSAKLLQN